MLFSYVYRWTGFCLICSYAFKWLSAASFISASLCCGSRQVRLKAGLLFALSGQESYARDL